ncbi:glycosyltransferase family 4 protein [Pseudonocardia sp. RS11V-5]|uniref:glycosyltransferase family 4 protein n=1 Tax=Pseudonocardia terrae TaxID=2905831 RepID=UPI001E3D5B57|nr:glycosyltransferase family 4 protein [Pseudonocardia terrae]MCE3554778.1 glycosyltransferase family 4 protein [Pseudonocardia terrae]
MRIGIVCPYSLDVPGGVQTHVVELARALRALGHAVSVLAPADEDTPVPDFVTSAGKALGVPYNGSVARVTFGPVTYARARRWLEKNAFDVLHLHEPTTFSISVLALLAAEGPIVATFHTSTERSRTLQAFGGVLRPLMEKVTARIAVSSLARRVQVEHLGGDAIEIPNGVDVARFASGPPLPGRDLPGPGRRTPTIGFVGRFTEPRKGMPVLLEALRSLDARLLVVGRGDPADLRREAGPVADRLHVLGTVDEDTKAAALRSVDVFCAPNLGGESFGMVLTEAMAAGAPVVASDLESFRRVLGEPDPAGVLVPTGDATALATALRGLLADPQRRALLSAAGRMRAADFDWPVVAAQVLQVYQAAVAADPRQVVAGRDAFPGGAA